MSPLSTAFTRQKLCVDFTSLKHACPKGIYVAPVPDDPLLWTGVLFVRKGPYANAVLRFQIQFPDEYPERPPVVTFQSDLFHPLVTPLTTYTYSSSSRDFGTDTQSAADKHRLPPGGLSLRHGFPEWFREESEVVQPKEQAPHIVELLQYLRIVFDTQEVLDVIPEDAAANNGAWHAWKTYRSKESASRGASVTRGEEAQHRSLSPRQQPGGARRPGEWNWQGVWEERVRRCVQASVSEQVLFGGDNHDVISFLKMDQEAVSQISPLQQTEAAAVP